MNDIFPGEPVPAYHDERLKWAVQNGCFAADDVAIGFQGTPAEKTRAVIERALEALITNGIITINDPEDWPPYFSPGKRFS